MVKPGRFYVMVDVHWYDEWGYQVSNDAALLWVLALGQAKQINSAILKISQLRRVAPMNMTDEIFATALQELIGCESPPISGDGLAIVLHGFSEWNVTSSESESGLYGNHIRWHVNKGKVDSTCKFCITGKCIAPESPPISPPESLQSIAIQSNSLLANDGKPSSKLKPKKPKKVETPVPDPFEITPQLKDWAVRGGHDRLDLDFHTANFVDHHIANGNEYVDWGRAWQKWIRNASAWNKDKSPDPARHPVVARGAGQMPPDEVEALYTGETIKLPGE